MDIEFSNGEQSDVLSLKFITSLSGLKVSDQLVARATRFLIVRLKNHV